MLVLTHTKITQINELQYSTLLNMFYLLALSRALVIVKATPCVVVHDSDSSSLMYRPVMDQTGSRLRWDRNRNIMNYGPCTTAASWPPPSGFT